MKRFRHQRRQRKEKGSPHKTLRLIVGRFSKESWDDCCIIYQDPSFRNISGKRPLSGYSYYDKHKTISIHSTGRPEFRRYSETIQIYLLGNTSETAFVCYPPSEIISHSILDFWRALDKWAREYSWPTDKIPGIPQCCYHLKYNVDNIKTRSPSARMLQEAKYMSFYSLSNRTR